MRRTTLLIVLASSLATATYAQQNNELTVFLSQSVAGRSRGYGAAYNRMWTPRFSTGISVGAEDADVTHCFGFFTQQCFQAKLQTHPVDLTGRFHFLNETRWKPYVGLGLRYVAAPDVPQEAVTRFGPYEDHVHPEVVGGLEFVIKPWFGITAEAKGVVGSSEDYDSLLKISAGLTWRF